MSDLLSPETFVEIARRRPVLDVRTPDEYEQGHVPGAHNLPLFSNDERAEIGTAYKNHGRHAAMMRGLDVVGPKMRELVETAASVIDDDEVLVHCWRGGMRSESVAWLLDFVGYRVQRLDGGYKAYRHFVLDTFARRWNMRILSGRTGAGKTEILHALRDRGAQVVDLEALARHKGSVFGGFGEAPTPTQQQFENELACRLLALDRRRTIWIEDESRRIGDVNVPDPLWTHMRASPVYVVDVPREERVARLVDDYGDVDPALLRDAIQHIEKRLGGLRTRQALAAVRDGDLHVACHHLLHYYDRAYDHGLSRRDQALVHRISAERCHADDLVSWLLEVDESAC